MNPIVRFLLAFFIGFVAMVIVVMIGFGLGPLLLGPDVVFKPGAYEATFTWQLIALGITLVAAFTGGVTARLIGRGPGVVYVIAVVAMAMAILGAVMEPPVPEAPPARPVDQPITDVFVNAAKYGREPLFTKVTKPIGTAAGLLLGAWVVRPRRRENDAD